MNIIPLLSDTFRYDNLFVRSSVHVPPRKRLLVILTGLIVLLQGLFASGAAPAESPDPNLPLDGPIVVTQVPVGSAAEMRGSLARGMLRSVYGENARLVVVRPDRTTRVLTEQFHSACEADVSFDGRRILFAGKKTASEEWNIYEMDSDGSEVRRVTRGVGNCRSPVYQSTLYTLDSPKPWYQLSFVSDAAGTLNEYVAIPATAVYSCELDGAHVRRLTFNLSSDMDPFLMADGRLVFAGWQRAALNRGIMGRVALFGVNLDGTDYAAFCTDEGRRIKVMPCATTQGLCVFVEADTLPWDGAGSLACVKLRRPLHSYRPITSKSDGLFHSPSPLSDGRVLVSRRPAAGSGSHAVYVLDPVSGRSRLVFDDPKFHDIHARLLRARAEPDGRSTVVKDEDPRGKLYCLNVNCSDGEDPEWLAGRKGLRVRLLEGVPLAKAEAKCFISSGGAAASGEPGSTMNGIPPLVQRRILGEVDVEKDGSFNVEVPANTPIQIQLIDDSGMALRSSGWIWAKNHEARGCIGCHEDGELTPPNRLVDGLTRLSVPLAASEEERRTVDFRRDVMPIIDARCAGCHGPGKEKPALDGGMSLVPHRIGGAFFNQAYETLLARDGTPGLFEGWKCVQPGSARASPLMRCVFGDDAVARKGMKRPSDRPPRAPRAQLTEAERRTFVEWVDMGALWDGIPGADAQPAGKRAGD